MFGRRQQTNQQPVNLQDIRVLETEIQNFPLADSPGSTILTAHELYLLEKAGYEVIQIVFGNIVYSMGLRGLFRSFQRAFMQGEMADFTRMINDARILARNRMLVNAKALGADKVIGIIIDANEYGDFLEVTATGTAVRRVGPMQETDVAVGI